MTRNHTASRGLRHGAGLTRDQAALIHVARRELHLEDDEYRALLNEAAGVTSSAQLDQDGFTKVLERFKAIGFVHRPGPNTAPMWPPKPRFGSRPGMATEAQIQLMLRLWSTWSPGADERALDHWMERSYGVTSVRFATVYVAQQAIDGLRAMVARKAAAPGSEHSR